MSPTPTDPQTSEDNPLVVASGTTSGLSIHLHPLPILNISEHYTRARLTSTAKDPKLIGALLGTPSNRHVSIVNSFELIYAASDDVDMSSDQGASGRYILDAEFLQTRSAQFKDVFPTLDVVGWYTVGTGPTPDDVAFQKQFASTIDTPVFLVFDPSEQGDSQDLPITIYESALTDATESGGAATSTETTAEGKFVKLDYAVETGEAERIAVDGVSKGFGSDESSVIGNLTTQRNAIRMLYDRIAVLSGYITDVVNGTAEPDYDILRQISSLVASLPTINAPTFREELNTEFDDVQLTMYLSNITKQLDALSEYTEKHHDVFPALVDEFTMQRMPAFGGIRARRK